MSNPELIHGYHVVEVEQQHVHPVEAAQQEAYDTPSNTQIAAVKQKSEAPKMEQGNSPEALRAKTMTMRKIGAFVAGGGLTVGALVGHYAGEKVAHEIFDNSLVKEALVVHNWLSGEGDGL